jgi:hypothetical protein
MLQSRPTTVASRQLLFESQTHLELIENRRFREKTSPNAGSKEFPAISDLTSDKDTNAMCYLKTAYQD